MATADQLPEHQCDWVRLMTMADTAPTTLAGEALDSYTTWLQQQPLAARTKASYLAQVRQYVQWLATLENSEELLPDHTRDSAHIGWGPAARAYEQRRQADLSRVKWAVGDYKGWMLTERRLAPRTVNLALVAIHNFYRSRGLAVPTEPEPVTRQAPKALDPKQVKALRRAAATLFVRDRAIVLTLLHTGIRRAELAALQVGDVATTRRKGALTVRSGKGNRFRTVPLNAECRKAIEAWKADRTRWPIRTDSDGDALWLSRLGNPLSSRAIADVVTNAGRAAGIPTLSAHTLRHTFVTRLVRNGTDPFMVADLAGHARVDTTLLYSLPTDDDRHSAVEARTP